MRVAVSSKERQDEVSDERFIREERICQP